MANKKYLDLVSLKDYHLKLKPVIESKANSSEVYNKNDVYTKDQVDAALDSKSNVGHTHDQYVNEQNVYTKEQVDSALESKSDISHTHDQYLTDIGIDISFNGSDTLKGTATDYKILGVDGTKTYYLSGTKFIGTGCTNITITPIIGTSATCTYDEKTGVVSWTIYGTSSSGPVSANLSWTGAPGILTSTKDGTKTTVGYFNTINGESIVNKTESKNFDIYTKNQIDTKLSSKADTSNVYSKSDVDTKLSEKANVSDVYTTTQVDSKLSSKADTSNVYNKSEINTKLNAKADASNVYSKSEVNTKLNAKANASDVYTTTQVDNKLSEKANASDVYTTTQVDNKLNTKANSSDVYTATTIDAKLNLKANASDVYTTTQIDNKLSEKADKATTLSGYGITDAYTKTETNNLINSKSNTTVFDTYNKFIEFLEDTSQATYDYFNIGDSIYIKEEGSDYWISGKEDIVEDADVYRYISGTTGSSLLGTDNIFRTTVTENIGTTYTSVTVDGLEPLDPSCGYSNFSWNSSTGVVKITLESLQPNKNVTVRLKCHVSASGGGDYGYYYISNIGPDISGKADKATTLNGYGITDAYTKTEVDTKLNGKADKATSLSGYGITDAYTTSQIDTKLNGKANLNGGNTFSGLQSINAPTNVSGSEQNTMKIKTSNGGAIIFGKEGPNSGTMIRLDQKDGTCRLRFRSSATSGAMVWEQPEQGAKLYIDLGKDGADKHRISFPSSAGTLALKSQIPTVNNGTLTIQKNGTNVQTFTANQSGNVTANITVPMKTSELTNDSGYIDNVTMAPSSSGSKWVSGPTGDISADFGDGPFYPVSGTTNIGTGLDEKNITITPGEGAKRATGSYNSSTGDYSWTLDGTNGNSTANGQIKWHSGDNQLKITKNGTTHTVGYFNSINGQSVISSDSSKNFSFYTKTETDNKLSGKADKATTLSGYGITNAYTKTESDNKYAPKSHTPESIIDYGDTSNTIKIGYRGNGLAASQIAYIAGYRVDDPNNPNEHKIKDISKDVLKSWLGYAEVATGTISPGGTLTATSGYAWIIFPYDFSNNTFEFSYGSGNRTGYGYAIVQGGGCIRYFSSTTQLTRYYVSSITFSTQMRYIKFKMNS